MRLKILRPEDFLDRIAVVVGTRPGIIKMSPLVRELDRMGKDYFVLHAGQHYSPDMDLRFFEELGLEKPRVRLEKVSKCYYHGEQTSEIIRGTEEALLDLRPKVVLVCGDANTNLAAGLAARKLHMIVGHVEAGLRSRDWSMPEEHNRIILDHICELLFAPTEEACENLRRDNVRGEIHLTGNTIMDAVQQSLEIARKSPGCAERLGLENGEYLLLTVHREENVDFRERLAQIVSAANLVHEKTGRAIIFPAHPRTRNRLKEFSLEATLGQGIRLTGPIGYLDFLKTLEGARVVLTDSGGVQEESCILGTPCVTLRNNTERPETLGAGANLLAGVEPAGVLRAVQEMMSCQTDWPNPYGDGRAAQRIIDISLRAMSDGFSLRG